MIAKYLIFAVAAVALAQCQDSGFEYEVQRALYRLKGMNTGVERGYEAAIQEVSINRDYLVMKPDDFMDKGVYARAQAKEKVQVLAAEAERKAEELKKPPTVIQCIEKEEKVAFDKIDASEPKYVADIKKQAKTASDAIDVAAKPLPEIKKEIGALYTKSQNELKSCKDHACLRSTMSKIRQQYDAIHGKIRQIFGAVETAFANFMKNASVAFGTYKKLLNVVLQDAAAAMDKCLTAKAFFLN